MHDGPLYIILLVLKCDSVHKYTAHMPNVTEICINSFILRPIQFFDNSYIIISILFSIFSRESRAIDWAYPSSSDKVGVLDYLLQVRIYLT